MDPCDGLSPDRRPICKCTKAGLTLDQCNRRRVAWGIPPLSQMPDQPPLTTVQKAVSLTSTLMQTVWRHVTSGDGILSEPEIQARLDICKSCGHFDGQHCGLCGCSCQSANIPKWFNKLAHRSSVCPHDPPKWGKVE